VPLNPPPPDLEADNRRLSAALASAEADTKEVGGLLAKHEAEVAAHAALAAQHAALQEEVTALREAAGAATQEELQQAAATIQQLQVRGAAEGRD
jgi:multidrug resistance efflux pump